MSVTNTDIIAKRLSKVQTGEKLDALRASVVRKVVGTSEEIHIWLLSEIREIEKHRNPTKMNQTLSKLEKTGIRTAAIHMFIQTFCNVKMTDTVKPSKDELSERAALSENKDYTVFYKVKAERKALSFFTGKKDGKAVYSTPIDYDKATEKGMDEYLALAAAKPWTEFRPEPTHTQFDFDKVGTSIANTLKRTFSAIHEQGSFKGVNTKLIADLYKVCLENGIDLRDVTAALVEMPKDAPAEVSNVIQFPVKTATETQNEVPATVNATPRPAKAARK